MIDKGDPSRAEFDDKIAEGAARLFCDENGKTATDETTNAARCPSWQPKIA